MLSRVGEALGGGIVLVDQEVASRSRYLELIDMVDELMYQAKTSGKNRIIASPETAPVGPGYQDHSTA